MNLIELRTFLEVVQARSLVGASRRLNVTQSTVTARLNALEREVGQRLLHRGKAGTELSAAGFKFTRYAEVMLQLWRQARSEVSLPAGFGAACNVGLDFDLWRGVGQRFLDHVRRRCPNVAIALWPGEQRQLDRWLDMGLIDLAFCYAPQAGEKFASRVLFDDELICVAGPSRLTTAPPPVYVDHGESFRREHAAAFPGESTAAVTIASSDWAVDHLLESGGRGYLPRRHVDVLLASGRLRAVPGPIFRRRVYLVDSPQAVAAWDWYEAALAAAIPPPTPAAAAPAGRAKAISRTAASHARRAAGASRGRPPNRNR